MAELKLPDEFIQTLKSLFEWFTAEKIPGTSIGGVAVSLIAQPRATQDIDAVIWLTEDRWKSFLDSGQRHGITPRINDALDFARQSRVFLLKNESSNVNIDVSIGGLEFEREMIERATTLSLGDLVLKVPTPEDLVITKAVAHRPKDLADIDAIVSAIPTLDRGRIRYWIKQFAEALEMPEIADNVEKVLQYYPAPTEAPAKGKQSKKKTRRKKQP